MKTRNIFRILFFAICMSVVLAGCSTEEDPPQKPQTTNTNAKNNNQNTNKDTDEDDDVNGVSHDRTQEQDKTNTDTTKVDPVVNNDDEGVEHLTEALCFTAKQANSSVRLFGVLDHFNSLNIQYSLDNKTWTDYTENSKVITLEKEGAKVWFRGNNPGGFNQQGRYVTFKAEGKIAASGNVMSLIDPTLQTTEIPNEYCFASLFEGCSALVSAPALPAEILKPNCYKLMFAKCTSLEKAPIIHAKKLADYACFEMFQNCTSLTQVPDFEEVELAPHCYNSMFMGCTQLQNAPELKSRTLATGCYSNMFKNCSALNNIKVYFSDWNNKEYTPYWVQGVASSGIFVCPEKLSKVFGNTNIPQGWTVDNSLQVEDVTDDNKDDDEPEIVDENNYLCFTAESANSTLSFAYKTDLKIEYSTDKKKWNVYQSEQTLTMSQVGDKLYFRGDNPQGISNDYNYSRFSMTGKIAASGNIMSLLDPSCQMTEIPQESCFNSLFQQCTSLTSAPELPATKLKNHCYYAMFNGCTSLTKAPELPATTLEVCCYWGMFRKCTSLTKAPKLPATTLAESCYENMFNMCSSLVTAPELPAKNLAAQCYHNMFRQTAITKAPELPATTLAEQCYERMFEGCANLNYIKVGFTSFGGTPLSSTPYTDGWLYDVAKTGSFYAPAGFNAEEKKDVYIPKGWTLYIDGIEYKEEQEIVDNNNYLCFTAEESGSTVGFYFGGNPDLNIEYSTDKKKWHQYTSGTIITLENSGDKVYFRGDNPYGLHEIYDNGISGASFEMTGRIAASGNVMSLIDKTCKSKTIPQERCFAGLFDGCASLTKAPELPATTLSVGCYKGMFEKCTSLTEAPELPATTLAPNCYNLMFMQCSNLTKAPELRATNLAESCYLQMFCKCTALKNAPELPATRLATRCYQVMFWGCTSLVNPPALNATTLAEDCYNGMFRECESLTKAPELPATNLVESCYLGMFKHCTNLSYIKVGFSSFNNSTKYTSGWLNEVASSGSFYAPSDFDLPQRGGSYVPEGWTLYKGGKEDKGEEEEVKKITLTYSLSDNSSEITQDDDLYVTFYADQYSTIQVFVDDDILKYQDDTKSLKVYLPTDNKGRYTVTAYATDDKTNSNHIEFSYNVVEKSQNNDDDDNFDDEDDNEDDNNDDEDDEEDDYDDEDDNNDDNYDDEEDDDNYDDDEEDDDDIDWD